LAADGGGTEELAGFPDGGGTEELAGFPDGGGTEELAGFPDLAVAALILSSASALTAAGSFDRVDDRADQSGAFAASSGVTLTRS